MPLRAYSRADLQGLHPSIYNLIYWVLKSYANGTISGFKYPPFIHAMQMQVPVPSQTLVNCFNIARKFDHPLPEVGRRSAKSSKREMSKTSELAASDFTDIDILTIFQAYLTYTMIAFFRLDLRKNLSFLREAMMRLQDLAYIASKQGLTSSADQQHTRPSWEAWLVTEAKRRTLYVLYLFDNVLSLQQGLPTFLETEIRGLPAPCSKSLWEAKTRREWDEKYNDHLVQWPGGGLRIDELWPIPADFNGASITRRRSRVDQWLVDVDEFGMMVYTVLSCTYGR
ncbi:hypothetical protein PG993_000288 [Apiospora rasikravindrae]|uniref:Xylanolytic transcriptional activator regulatory domain-containing protein n=1 Tax=Apiospora rasikravindrae TaxID=990691 RepID=A0ABR1U826_9PEZI